MLIMITDMITDSYHDDHRHDPHHIHDQYDDPFWIRTCDHNSLDRDLYQVQRDPSCEKLKQRAVLHNSGDHCHDGDEDDMMMMMMMVIMMKVMIIMIMMMLILQFQSRLWTNSVYQKYLPHMKVLLSIRIGLFFVHTPHIFEEYILKIKIKEKANFRLELASALWPPSP